MRTLTRPDATLALAAVHWVDQNGVRRPWESKANAILTFKENFREWALRNQDGRCAFCRLPLGTVSTRRTPSLDHFAPKARYPQWVFEVLNLLAACYACNSSLKNSTDPVLLMGCIYEQSQFRVVHPYLDEVPEHISGGFVEESLHPEPVTHLSDRGRSTIELFELDDPGLLNTWRKEHHAWSWNNALNHMSQTDVALLQAARQELSGA